MNHAATPIETTPIIPDYPLAIMPLRYAVVCTDDPNARQSVDPLGGTLGEGVIDLTLSHNSFYSIRTCRPGYFYMLIELHGSKNWQVYRFDADNSITRVWPDAVHSEYKDYDDVTIPVVYYSNEVQNLWYFFSPDPLTPKKLKEYEDHANSYVEQGKVQHFNPMEYLDGNREQLHVVLTDSNIQFDKKVADYYALDELDSSLRQELFEQLFPLNIFDSVSLMNLVSIRTEILAHRSVGLAVKDPIGITQELNNFRNKIIDEFEQSLHKPDHFGVNDYRRLQVSEAIESVKEGFVNGYIADQDKVTNDKEGESIAKLKKLLNDPMYLHRHEFEYRHAVSKLEVYYQIRNGITDPIAKKNFDNKVIEPLIDRIGVMYAEAVKDRKPYIQEYQQELAEMKVDYQEKSVLINQEKAEHTQEATEKWRKKYAARLDIDELEGFRNSFNERKANAFQEFDRRIPSHQRWFESDRLVDAFDLYDPEDQNSGFDFAVQSAICSIGATGTPAGEALVDKWIKADSIARPNLYMRGFYHNQEELMVQANSMYVDLKSVAPVIEARSDEVTLAQILKACRGTVKAFKATDAAYDEWVRNYTKNQKKENPNAFIRDWPKPGVVAKKLGMKHGIEAVLFSKIWDINRFVFRSVISPLNPLDRLISYRLKTSLFSRLSDAAEHYAKILTPSASFSPKMFDDLMADAKKEQATTRKTLDQIIDGDKAHVNNYHHVRIGGLLLGLEMITMGEIFSRAELDFKTALEITASLSTSLSLSMDIMYAGAKAMREHIEHLGDSRLDRASDAVRGGFKLSAALFASIASVASAVMNGYKFHKEFTRKDVDPVICALSLASLGTDLTSAGFGLRVARGYALEYFKYKALKKTGSDLIKDKLEESIEKIATNRVRHLVWLARVSWIGIALTTVEIAYIVFGDNDLQNWLDSCTFRDYKFHANILGTPQYFETVEEELETLFKAAQSANIPI